MRFAKFPYLALGLALLVVIFRDADLDEIAGYVKEVGAAGMAAVVFLYFLAFLGDSVSWCLTITSTPNSLVWFRRAFFVRLAGEAFNNILPAAGFGGEPVKAAILKRRYDVGYGEATASIVMSRTINMIALILFLAVGFAFLMLSPAFGPKIRFVAAIGFAALTFGTVAMFAIQRFRLSSRLATRLGSGRGGQWIVNAIAAVEDVDRRFLAFYTEHRGKFFAAFVFAFGNWVLGVAEIYATFYFLGHPISWQEAWIVESVAQMVRSAVFFIPAGIGAQEGTFLVICGAITGNPALGLAASVVRRIREVLWIVLGLLAAAFYPTTLRKDAGGINSL